MAEKNERVSAPTRIREQIRTELIEAASSQFLQRGLTATTIDDIVNEVGVSRRTFFRYFPTKEDAVLQPVEAVGPLIARALAARPADEGPARALRQSLDVLAQDFADQESRWRSVLLLNRDNPSLRARHLAKQDDWQAAIVEVLASRLQAERNDPRPLLFCAIALAAVDSALHAVADLPAGTKLGPHLDNSFNLITEFSLTIAQ
nr:MULTISPECIES: TetR family transcriptional regulator [Actinomycetes]